MSEQEKTFNVHPVQPLIYDSQGVLRFKENKIIGHLFETGELNLNKIATMGFKESDHEQLAQLLGYSLSGFADLSYVSDETYERAQNQICLCNQVTDLTKENIELRQANADKFGQIEPLKKQVNDYQKRLEELTVRNAHIIKILEHDKNKSEKWIYTDTDSMFRDLDDDGELEVIQAATKRILDKDK